MELIHCAYFNLFEPMDGDRGLLVTSFLPRLISPTLRISDTRLYRLERGWWAEGEEEGAVFERVYIKSRENLTTLGPPPPPPTKAIILYFRTPGVVNE